MEISKYQKAVLLLSQKYFVSSTRTEEGILVLADDPSEVRNSLKSIDINNFQISSYIGDGNKRIVIVSFY